MKSLEKTMPYAWVVLACNGLFLFYKYVLQVSPSVITQQLSAQFHLNGVGLGNLAATYFYTFLFAQLVVGYLLDRYSPRWLTVGALLVCALGTYCFATADTLYTALLGRALMGVGVAFATVSYLKQAAMWFPKKRLAMVGGLLASAVGVGALVGQAPLAALVNYLGWHKALLSVSWAGVALALLYALLVRDKKTTASTGKQAATVKPAFDFKKLLDVVKEKSNWVLTLYSGLAFAPLAVFGGLWGNPFLQTAYHLTTTQAASYVTLVFVGLGLGAPLWGVCSDRFGHRLKVMASGTALSLVCVLTALYLPANAHATLATSLFLFGFGTGSFMTGFTLAKEWNPVAMAATVVAMVNTGDALFGAFTEPLVGKLLDVYSPAAHSGQVFSLAAYHHALVLLPVYLSLALLTAAYLGYSRRSKSENKLKTSKQCYVVAA